MRATVYSLSVLAATLATSLATTASGQELANKGILVTQIFARTRMFTYEKGDLMHVTVRQPAGSKGVAVSLHAEFKGTAGKWQAVPPPTTPIAPAYTSPHYGGLRDYVELQTSSEPSEQNVALFVPFNGFSLEPGRDYDLRYVVRLWNEADKEVGTLELEPQRVQVGREGNGIVVRALEAQPCQFLSSSQAGSAAQSAGVVRFFDAKTGKWFCPEGSQPPSRATFKRQ